MKNNAFLIIGTRLGFSFRPLQGRRTCAVLAFILGLVAGTGSAWAGPGNDEAYTRQIRKNTTESFFLTPLVDHLPASDVVPSPQKILGYAIGTPGKLSYTKDIDRYYRALAAASPRVKVFPVGKSEEGREMLLVAVSDETNISQLDHYRDITGRLADPRKLSDDQAQQLIGEGKPFYWASASIHSPETGSPEMLMELAYRLAVEDTPFIRDIRKNLIFLITPVVEVDGRDRMVDLYNYRLAHPGQAVPNLIYWGHYVAHDNNRDNITMSLKLSQAMMHNFLHWHPQVLHDLHESVPYLYVSTGTGPYNAWLDPITINEWQRMAYNEVQTLTEWGVPGVWTHGFYDGWAPNYMFYVANGHNSIGRFYETFGNGGADTRERTLGPSQTSRHWYRPNPPLAKVKWSIRDNINLQQSGLLLALKYTADRGQQFLRNFYLKSLRSVKKATTEGPAAWAIVKDDKRPTLAARLVAVLQRQGVEVEQLDGEFVLPAAAKKETPNRKADDSKDKTSSQKKAAGTGNKPGEAEEVHLAAGSYIVRMDQPYSRMADMLLDTQYYSTQDPRPYDDTGWTLGPLFNVQTLRITDTGILKAPMHELSAPFKETGAVAAPQQGTARYYLVSANGAPELATLRYRLRDLQIEAAEGNFQVDGRHFPAGTFLIPAGGNPPDLASRLASAAAELGLNFEAVSSRPEVKSHSLAVPRIAILHTWLNTQNEGWFRMAMDSIHVPYSYISAQDVRRMPRLRDQFDVIIFPPVTSNVSALITGIPRLNRSDGSGFGSPLPWKKTPLTPNLGVLDETADMRGGLGLEGLVHLKQFIEEGGLFIPITISAHLPIEEGMTWGVSINRSGKLQARGGVFNATVEDSLSPIAYGYGKQVALYFSQSPVFRISVAGNRGRFGSGKDSGRRPSGRGSQTDPDIPQGRHWSPPERQPHRSKVEQETYVSEDLPDYIRALIPERTMWPRVVVRFASEKSLWVSGMLAGGAELARTPAVIDEPVGKGHVVFFANNPMWRQETQGSFMLLLNAVLHFDHLSAGREAGRPPETKSTAGGK